MSAGKAAVGLIVNLWPNAAKRMTPDIAALIVRDVEAARLDDAQVRAMLHEQRRAEKFFDFADLSARIAAVTGRREQSSRVDWRAEGAQVNDARARRLRDAWNDAERIGAVTRAETADALRLFSTFNRWAVGMIAWDWPLEGANPNDGQLVEIARAFLARCLKIEANRKPVRPPRYTGEYVAAVG